MAFRIPAGDVPTAMEALWRREMPSGAYTPKWLNCRTNDGPITALAFTMNRNTDAYVSGLPVDRLVQIVRNAHRSEEHTSELQSLMRISYAVFYLKKQNQNTILN